MKLLFICSRNRLRSPTAEAVFSVLDGFEALSAGTSSDADNPISSDLIAWADMIFVMETIHHQKLKRRFSSMLKQKRVVVLGIPDHYDYMDAELVRVLKSKVFRYIDPEQ